MSMPCGGHGLETYVWPNKVTVGNKLKVRCRDCHRVVQGTITKQANNTVTVDLPKHDRLEPWHKRG